MVREPRRNRPGPGEAALRHECATGLASPGLLPPVWDSSQAGPSRDTCDPRVWGPQSPGVASVSLTLGVAAGDNCGGAWHRTHGDTRSARGGHAGRGQGDVSVERGI